jgi:MFS family permease
MLGELPAWLRAVLVGQFVSAAGALTWVYLALYLVQARGLDPASAGLIVSGYGVGVISGNLFGGWFGDRFGVRRTLLVSQTSWVVGCILVPFEPTSLLAVTVAVAGAVAGAGRPLMSTTVALAVPAQRRREAIALSRVAFNAGTVTGPPLGALVAAHHFGWVFVFDAVTSAALVVVLWLRVPAVSRPDGPRAPMVRLWPALRGDRRVLALLGCVLAVDTVYRLMYCVLPVQLSQAGEPTLLYGALVTLNCLIIVIAEPPLALRLRHRPALPVVATGFALAGAGVAVLSGGSTAATAVAMMVVVTAGEMLYKPTATAFAADAAPAGLAARYQSLYAAASVGGSVLSPALGLSLYQRAPLLVWPLAAVLALAAAGVMYAMRGAPEPAVGVAADA